MPSRVHRRGRVVSRASFSVIAALFFVLSTSLAIGVAGQLHQRSVASLEPLSKPKYLVLIVLDGAQPDVLHLRPLPHLDGLRTQGVEYTNAWAGILESETPAGHATLATGSTPARDGLLGFNWITGDNDVIHLFDPNTVRQGAIEHVMQQAGAATIAGDFKARYPRTKVVAISGHKYYAADPLGGPDADYIMYYAPDQNNHYVPTAIPGHVPPASVFSGPGLTTPTTTLAPGVEDTLATRLAINTFHHVHQQVTLINMPEFDWPLGHVDGADRPHTVQLMRDFDHNLGMLEDAYRQAGVLDRTLFVITADHGMEQLKVQIPDRVLDDAVTKAGATAPETTYSTAGYIWLNSPSYAQAVASNIVAAKDPHIQSVYYLITDKSGQHYVSATSSAVPPDVDHANQVLLGSFLGGNAPDVVAFCTEDAAFVKAGGETWKGNHGGGSWQSQHIPLVISGAGVAQGMVTQSPARLEDVAPTVLTIMGAEPKGMQGIPLADAMSNPSADQQTRQAQLNTRLTPVVNALALQSQRELSR